jgi:hypothetical protein
MFHTKQAYMQTVVEFSDFNYSDKEHEYKPK